MDYLAERPDHVRFDCELLVRLSQHFANVGYLHSYKPLEVELRDIRKMVADAAALKRFNELLDELWASYPGSTAIHEILERISATR